MPIIRIPQGTPDDSAPQQDGGFNARAQALKQSERNQFKQQLAGAIFTAAGLAAGGIKANRAEAAAAEAGDFDVDAQAILNSANVAVQETVTDTAFDQEATEEHIGAIQDSVIDNLTARADQIESPKARKAAHDFIDKRLSTQMQQLRENGLKSLQKVEKDQFEGALIRNAQAAVAGGAEPERSQVRDRFRA